MTNTGPKLNDVIVYLTQAKKSSDLDTVRIARNSQHPFLECTCNSLDLLPKPYVRREGKNGPFWACANYGINNSKGCGTLNSTTEFKIMQGLKNGLTTKYGVAFDPIVKNDEEQQDVDANGRTTKRAALPSSPEVRAIFSPHQVRLAQFAGATPVNHSPPLFVPKSETFIKDLIGSVATNHTVTPPKPAFPDMPDFLTWHEYRHLATKSSEKASKQKALPTVDLTLVHPAKNHVDDAVQFVAKNMGAMRIIGINAFTAISHFIHASLVDKHNNVYGVAVLPPHVDNGTIMFRGEELENSIATWLLVPSASNDGQWTIINLPKFRSVVSPILELLPIQNVGVAVTRDDLQNCETTITPVVFPTYTMQSDNNNDQDVDFVKWLREETLRLREAIVTETKKQIRSPSAITTYHDTHSDHIVCGVECRTPLNDPNDVTMLVDQTIRSVNVNDLTCFARVNFTDPNQFTDPGQTQYTHVVCPILKLIEFAHEHELIVAL